MQNQKNKTFNQAKAQELLIAWELNTKKLMSLLEQTLFLRLRLQEIVAENEFSDVVFIDSLETILKQFQALTNKD